MHPRGVHPRLRVAAAVILATVLLGGKFAAAQVSDAPGWEVRSEPEVLVNGAAGLLRVTPPVPLKNLSGSWLDHKLYFSFDGVSKTWYAIFGVDVTTAAGLHQVSLSGETATGIPREYEQSLEIAAQTYPHVTLSVLRRFTAPPPKQLNRIKRERLLKYKIFERSSDRRLWHGRFMAPVSTTVSEGFGVSRMFNGELQTRHEGVDYHAAAGTPVLAANSGRVLLARNLYFEGNCVVVDHGQGLMTLYMHLSKFRVKAGQKVSRGQVLGRSGATGRVTGPHLHLGLRWEGTYLDPDTLLQLQLP